MSVSRLSSIVFKRLSSIVVDVQLRYVAANITLLINAKDKLCRKLKLTKLDF